MIVPCYNTAIYLPQCLNHLLSQTYQNLEIICVNDGSTDHTETILQDFAKIDNRIRIISQTNSGLCAVRNVGIKACTGEYLTFVDSDDYIEINYFERIIQHLSNADLAFWGYSKFSEKYCSEVHVVNEMQHYEGDSYQRLLQRVIGPISTQLQHPERIDSLSSVCVKLLKTEIIKRNNLQFDSRVQGGEDMLFTIQYLKCARSAVGLPFTGYYYRRNFSSITRAYNPSLLGKWELLYTLLWEEVQDLPQFHTAYHNRRAISIVGVLLNQINVSRSIIVQRNKVKEILKSPLYADAFDTFDITALPLKWKFFFSSVKKHKYISVTFLTNIINRLR